MFYTFLILSSIIEFKPRNSMQLKFYHNSPYASTKLLQKSTSLPTFTETTNSSSNSIESLDQEEYRKLIIKWIFSFNKKVAKDTQYMAIVYLQNLTKKAITLSEENYEQIAITLVLMASKMNEIYPPKLALLLAKSKKHPSRQQIIALEGKILQALNYDIALENTCYSLISNILGDLHAQKLQQCQKLLRIIVSYREVYQYGQQILSYSIIYLIIPKFIKDLRLRQGQNIKRLAIRIYNIYSQTKQRYQKEKQNRAN